MIKISPSILSCDFSNLEKEIVKLDKSDAEYIHIDVMDGVFVPNITIGPLIVKAIRRFTKKVFDVHLMIINPEKYINVFSEVGSDIIGIHREIQGNIIQILKDIRNLGKKASLTYNPETPVDDIEKYLDYVDQILIMSVHPGFGGQKFISDVLSKGDFVKNLIIKKNLKIDLEIDGGVNFDNAEEIKKHGFDILVSGSTIFKHENINEAINKLK